jgi:hypothetical protein
VTAKHIYILIEKYIFSESCNSFHTIALVQFDSCYANFSGLCKKIVLAMSFFNVSDKYLRNSYEI